MSQERSLVQPTAASMTPTPSHDSEGRPKPLNPRLCGQCQAWDDISALKLHLLPARSFACLEESSRDTGCLVCRAIVDVVDARFGRVIQPGSIPEGLARLLEVEPSEVSVDVYGHLFWDVPSRYRTLEQLLDHNDGRVRVMVKLHIAHDSLKRRPARGDGSPVREHNKSRLTATPRFCLRYTLDTPHALESIERWEFPFFHTPLLRAWVEGCEDLHRGRCDDVRGIEPPPGFRVVDVRSMRVVQPANPVSFVALSYLWGPQDDENGRVQLQQRNLKELETVGSLGRLQLPGVLSDAIQLCAALGKWYLWIDRLCIVQDDARSKHGQISQMDKIYQSAALTIVAALNNRMGSGLPGFRGRPRNISVWDQVRWFGHQRPFMGLGRHHTPRIIEGLVERSLWNQRGWTFQERLMSRRCLFITEAEVVFQCRCGYASEESSQHRDPSTERAFQDLEEDIRPTRLEHSRMPGFRKDEPGESKHSSVWAIGPSLTSYFELVLDYTSRELSFKSDILSAFCGVGNALSEALGSRMLFGVPERYLPAALMWDYAGTPGLEREAYDIPSWSWASAVQPAVVRHYRSEHDPVPMYAMPDFGGSKYASLVVFHFQDPDHGFRRLDVLEQWIDHEVTMDELGGQATLPAVEVGERYRDLDIDMPAKRFEPNCDVTLTTSEVWKECPHNPWQVLVHSSLDTECRRVASQHPGSLIFNTTAATLKASCPQAMVEYRIPAAELYNQDGRVVGWMPSTSAEWRSMLSISETEWDFIVICGTLADKRAHIISQNDTQYSDKRWVRSMWRLLVLVVERLSLKPYVARRKGVGYINMHEWAGCKPRWETVVLC
ncbi:hypothetical protein MFIFM68171_03649 [Madurella fahalii]|uniref:Heterokaryon incompatibility domain-containing protein n=1 Tax=Madurella fahalii TaxID=1157608 RepID=A0ABQ0G700_9PEZI